VAATVASLAAALAEMVLNITLAGSTVSDAPSDVATSVQKATELRSRLLDLASEDEAAYAGYRAAATLPRGTDEEKAQRRDAIERALHLAAETPLRIAKGALEVLDLLEIAAGIGTKHALSDIATGAMLADAAARSALLNVEVNAGLMKDPAAAERFRSEATEVEERSRTGAARVNAAISARN
jgi:formiminotetrahydrofolate cyclodeaminase